jgi:hypothetical protein
MRPHEAARSVRATARMAGTGAGRSEARALAPARGLLAAVLAVAIALVAAGALSACADDESQARQAATAILDALRDPTREGLAGLVGDSSSSELDAAEAELAGEGIDLYDLMSHLGAHFDYAIDSVQVTGDEAVVAVSSSNADFSAAMASAEQRADDWLASDEGRQAYEAGDQEAISRHYAELLYEEIDASTQTVGTEGELRLRRDGSSWKLEDDCQDELASIFFAGQQDVW